MAKAIPQQLPASVITALLVTGAGIGWLLGLSVSPVVLIVVTSVTGVTATVIAALSGVKDEFLEPESSPKIIKRFLKTVTPVPLALLVTGLWLGSIAGIWVRTHSWLSPSLAQEAQQWVALGIPADDVARRLFESRIFITPTLSTVASINPPQPSVLYATASPAECAAWQALIDKGRYADLATEVSSSAVKPFRALPAIITNPTQLAAVVAEVLCVDTQP